MSKKNTGAEFESLTERLFVRLLAQERICSSVQRDVVVAGRATTHQLDVTFTFSLGGVQYRTIIQCKDWKSAVKQEQVLAFHSVLDDVPGQPRGIMVSRSGFQKGAKEAATHHGIQLYELRPPREEDWDGLIKRAVITGIIYAPQFRNARFEFDREWLSEQLKGKGIPDHELDITVYPDLHAAYLETGEPFELKTALNPYIQGGACDWTPIHHDFAVPVMVTVPDYYVPRLRVTSIDAELRVEELRSTMTIDLDHLVAYCFRDVLAGTHRFLGPGGEPLGSARSPDEDVA